MTSSGCACHRGFSLIELMIAMTLALFLVLVVVAATLTVGVTSRAQSETVTLQENARHALREIARDLRRGASSYCLNFAATDGSSSSEAIASVDQRRPIVALADMTETPVALGSSAVAGLTHYFVDPAELVVGSECGAASSTCAPAPEAMPALATQPLPAVAFPPAPAGRARGSDVLSMRYLAGPGRRLSNFEFSTAESGSIPVQITLAPGESAEAATRVLVTDCATAFVARVLEAGGVLRFDPSLSHESGDVAPRVDLAAARLFDLERDLATVSWYLRLDAHPDTGRLVSTLVRRSNSVDAVVAEGIDRLDFLYHVELVDGSTAVLDGREVDALSEVQCRGLAVPSGVPVSPARCGWRSLKGVEVFLLASSPIADASGGNAGIRYAWMSDGSINDDASFETPAMLPSGLSPGRNMRREFRTYVALRGMNP